VADVNARFGVGADDRVLALAALSFDLSVYDVFGVLAAGGALVLPEPWARRDPGRWLELAATHGVTLWNSVPALLEMLVEYTQGRPEDGSRLSSLRPTLLLGAWVPVTLPERMRTLNNRVELVSL